MKKSDVEIVEQDFIQDGVKIGTIAFFRGGMRSNNPTAKLNAAVKEYTKNIGNKYSEFVNITMDNPWVRILVSTDTDVEIKYSKFNTQELVSKTKLDTAGIDGVIQELINYGFDVIRVYQTSGIINDSMYVVKSLNYKYIEDILDSFKKDIYICIYDVKLIQGSPELYQIRCAQI